MRRLIRHALGPAHPARALFALPSSGRVLLSGADGTWIVRRDGSTRRLGPWREASWSPHGRFVAVTGRDELAAIDSHGTIRWRVARPAVADPRWSSPTGYRVAYLSAGELRVITGDGTADHVVASGVASVAPAWRPGYPYELAYVTRAGVLVVRDGDSGRLLWWSSAGSIRTLAWSADGARLVAIGRAGASVYGARGRRLTSVAASGTTPLLDGALSPDGRTLALVHGGTAGEVVLERLGARHAPERLLAGDGLGQLAWSPDGRWLLVSWPTADEWVFVSVSGGPPIALFSRLAQGLSAHGRPEGWCCGRRGAGG